MLDLTHDMYNMTMLQVIINKEHDKEIDHLYDEIAHLALQGMPGLLNKGKPIEEVSLWQAQRKLGEFKNKAKAVLWFVESYGLKPTVLELETTAHNPVKLVLG